MKVNVGGADCILRIAAGPVLIGLTLAGNIGIWGLIGLIFFATGIFSFCPAYGLCRHSHFFTFFDLFCFGFIMSIMSSLSSL